MTRTVNAVAALVKTGVALISTFAEVNRGGAELTVRPQYCGSPLPNAL